MFHPSLSPRLASRRFGLRWRHDNDVDRRPAGIARYSFDDECFQGWPRFPVRNGQLVVVGKNCSTRRAAEIKRWSDVFISDADIAMQNECVDPPQISFGQFNFVVAEMAFDSFFAIRRHAHGSFSNGMLTCPGTARQ